MNIQSWMIKSWATLEWYLPLQAEALPKFKHVGSQLRDDGSCTGFRAGDTVWMADDEQRAVGLAWEWVEVKPGVVMLADPNSIITNLQFVDDHQHTVYGLAKTVAINRLVHALAWQLPVCGLLQQSAPADGQDARQAAARALESSRLATARPADEARAVQPLLTTALNARSYVAGFNAGSGDLRKSTQTAELRQLPSLRRRAAAEAPRRARSRASDHEDGIESAALRDQRRAA